MNNTVKHGKKPFIIHPDMFISGLIFNKGFYNDVVLDILKDNFRSIHYSAGLPGHCSDCPGFETLLSTDHGWEPRLLIFLSKSDHTLV